MKKKRKKKNAALKWHLGLGSVPDAHNKDKFAAASFAVELFGTKNSLDNAVVKTFHIQVAEHNVVKWNTVIYNQQMFICIPTSPLPVSSKESFVSMLEVAEEEYDCQQVICCLPLARKDRSDLVRTFMFMGFQAIPANSPMLPPGGETSGKYMFLGCEL